MSNGYDIMMQMARERAENLNFRKMKKLGPLMKKLKTAVDFSFKAVWERNQRMGKITLLTYGTDLWFAIIRMTPIHNASSSGRERPRGKRDGRALAALDHLNHVGSR